MPSEDLKKHVEDVISLLGNDTKIEVNAEEIKGQLERFLEYGVPLHQAKQTLLKKYGASAGVATKALERTKLADLQPHMKSVKIVGQVVSINPKDITVKGEPRQIFYGILRDESGSVSFTSWHDMQVNRGDIIEIGNAYTNEWQGAVQVNIGDRTHVAKKDESALPKEAYEPTKCHINDIYPGMGAVDMEVLVMEVDKKEVEVEGDTKTMFTGVFGDQTGKIPFTAWHDFKLKKEDTISLIGGYVRSFRGMPQISFDENAQVKKTKKTTISLDVIPDHTLALYEVEEHSGMFDIKIKGRVIEIQRGSGFILRCPECNRMLRDGTCQVHGSVDGIPDLRIKCIIDDGTGSVSAIFNQDITEHALGKTMDECKQLEPGVLMHLIQDTLFANLFSLKGNTMRDNFGVTFLPSALEKIEINAKEIAETLQTTLDEGGKQ